MAAGHQQILVDLDAAWGPFGPDDRLTLSNRTGIDLHNCTILVELRATGGDAVPNVFFMPNWPAGTPIHARCTKGTEVLGEMYGRRTVPRVESIVTSLWSDELTRGPETSIYAGAERDADVGRYCGDMKVDASYQPFAKGIFWNTERGVIVRLRGLKFAPNPRVTVFFTRGSSELSWYWDFDRWDEGQEKILDSGGKLPWDPESYRVVVGFPDTAYKHQSTWTPR